MSTRKPPSPEPTEPSGPAPAGGSAPAPAGPPVDVRPSEAELAEQREKAGAGGAPRRSEGELAEERAVPAPAPPPEAPKP